MAQTILTDAQKSVLVEIAKEELMAQFYLTGGTALAEFYFQHRLSEDLDFFTRDSVPQETVHGIAERVTKAIGARGMRFERKYDRRMFFLAMPDGAEVKIEFTKYIFEQLETPQMRNGIRVDSLRDIAANKLMAVTDRFDPKDFVDLFYLLRQFSLERVRKDVEKKFDARMGSMFLGSELAKARYIESLPRMLVPLTIEELKDFFSKQADALRDEVLA